MNTAQRREIDAKRNTSNMAPGWTPAPAPRINGTGTPGEPVTVSRRMVDGRRFTVTELAPVLPKRSNRMPTPYRVIGSTASQATKTGRIGRTAAKPSISTKGTGTGSAAYSAAARALGA